MASSNTPAPYFFTKRGKRLTFKAGDFNPNQVVTSPVVERIRIRKSNDQGLTGSVRITNPRASQFGRAKKTASIGMGRLGQTDNS